MKPTAASINRKTLWLAVLSLSLAATVQADEDRGITVSGTGVAEALPDTVEVTATVEGKAELAGDALEKYRGSKRRVVESLEGLKIAGVSVVGAGLSITSGSPANFMAALQGNANEPKAADKVAVKERLKITLSGVNAATSDELLQFVSRIVDVVKDAGVAVGPAPKSMIEMQLGNAEAGALARFKLAHPDALRQQAYEAALKQARTKAEHLAKLAGVELGGIVAIRETAAGASDQGGAPGAMATYFAMFGGQSAKAPDESSSELHAIPVSVTLNVQFEIVKK